jgi:hypothetical protein
MSDDLDGIPTFVAVAEAIGTRTSTTATMMDGFAQAEVRNLSCRSQATGAAGADESERSV